MSRKGRIEQLLKSSLNPAWFEVIDESSQHAGREGKESHFHISVASTVFEGKSRVQRHRQVYELLTDEFKLGLHAVTLNLILPSELEGGKFTPSPSCAHKK